jgi:hypothetical protein
MSVSRRRVVSVLVLEFGPQLGIADVRSSNPAWYLS